MLKFFPSQRNILKYFFAILITILLAAIMDFIGNVLLKNLIAINDFNRYLFHRSFGSYLFNSLILCLLMSFIYLITIFFLVTNIRLLVKCLLSSFIMFIIIYLISSTTFGFSLNIYTMKNLTAYLSASFVFPIIISLFNKWETLTN